ncbi:MAG TPA: hypothetical protein P5119_02000 [Candidatus Aminicenantes bacterium]|nr:hypothetical protein [Candidatus Aminicenantes bacterium]HRY64094.1 hypothetical protein [Candidatus Aminicenantes bacterium]HRZ71007.1 hypothetical protein [Candidatus Aminicenantes bacterium]
MKRLFTALLVVVLAGFAAISPAWGQEKKLAFSLNAGVQTDIFNGSSFDKALFTADVRVGFLLGRNFEISPEAMVVFNYLSLFFEGGNGTLVYPGVMVNLRTGNFFVGAGAVLPWGFYEGDSDTGSLAPKINLGYRFPNGIQLTAYYLCWTDEGIDLFDAGFAGVTLGYRF